MLPDLFRFSSAHMTRARLKWLATSLVGSRQRQVSTRAPRLGDPARAAAHTRGGRAFRGAMRLLLAGERRPLRSRLLVRPTSSCGARSEEHTSELQSLMRISYAVFCLKKKNKNSTHNE